MSTTKITIDLLDAIKVKFLQQIFEEDFPERGMIAWLTKIEWSDAWASYQLYFDFSEFEDYNDKYFVAVFNSNNFTKELSRQTSRTTFTAKEAGYYNPKYDVLFSLDSLKRDDAAFAQEIQKFLMVI